MNTELEDRLQALGAHLDAERAAHTNDAALGGTTTNVVSLDSRRRAPLLVAAAVVVLVAAGITAIALNRGESPDPSVPATDPTTVDTPTTLGTTVAPSTTIPPTGAVGTLTIDYLVDSGDPNEVVDRLTSRGLAARLDAAVSMDQRTVTVVVRNLPDTEQEAVLEALNSVGEAVQLRPVTAECTADDGNTNTPSNPAATQSLPVLGVLQRCEVGPSLGTGAVFERDAAVQPIDASTPAVVVSLRPGADGNDVWNELAGHCYDRDTTCPTGQLAVELGGWLYSAPTVQTPEFFGNVQLTGAWTDLDAAVLADALNHDDPTFRLTTKSYVFSFGG